MLWLLFNYLQATHSIWQLYPFTFLYYLIS
nr:MAG TPA_asm: hypothetical protein [Caudoviricetes sp.]